jgi:hypothetical protein
MVFTIATKNDEDTASASFEGSGQLIVLGVTRRLVAADNNAVAHHGTFSHHRYTHVLHYQTTAGRLEDIDHAGRPGGASLILPAPAYANDIDQVVYHGSIMSKRWSSRSYETTSKGKGGERGEERR